MCVERPIDKGKQTEIKRKELNCGLEVKYKIKPLLQLTKTQLNRKVMLSLLMKAGDLSVTTLQLVQCSIDSAIIFCFYERYTANCISF